MNDIKFIKTQSFLKKDGEVIIQDDKISVEKVDPPSMLTQQVKFKPLENFRRS